MERFELDPIAIRRWIEEDKDKIKMENGIIVVESENPISQLRVGVLVGAHVSNGVWS